MKRAEKQPNSCELSRVFLSEFKQVFQYNLPLRMVGSPSMAKSPEDHRAGTSALPKRKRKWVKWTVVTIVALGIISVMTDEKDADPPGAAGRQAQTEIALEPQAKPGPASAEMDQGADGEKPSARMAPPSNALQAEQANSDAKNHFLQELEMLGGNSNPAEWNVHAFRVVTDEDISFSNRFRRRVTIVAPTALTREDRIATLIEAATQVWQKHHSQFIAMFLLPFESGPVVARIDYAPDKCGVSGQDCTDRVWTDSHASDVVFTPEQQRIYTAWENNRDWFKQLDEDFGFEVVNEKQLKAFLAEQFNTTPDSISEVMTHAGAAILQEEMTVPHNLELRGHLNDQEQEKSEEMACRASLQCWGDKHSLSASVYCPDEIEGLGRYDHEWIDGWLGSKFSRFAWKDRTAGTVTYIGDQIKFQNGFGAWIQHTYQCDFDPVNKRVLDVRAAAGRL